MEQKTLKHPKKKSTSFKKRLTLILAGFVLVGTLIRALLPIFLLRHLNEYLGTFSPQYSIHMRDLEIHLWRMAYTFDDVEGFLKKDAIEFASIKKIDISLAWRELFRGRFIADIDVDHANLKVSKASIDAVSGYDPKQVKNDAKNVKDATVPFNVERLTFKDSNFLLSDIADLPPEQSFQLSHIEGIANNLTPADKNALTMFSASGAVQGTAKIKLVGQARTKLTPADWSVNVEMKDFDLSKINPIAWRTVPISFKKGRLSLYSAIQSLNGKMRGYVKPFIRDMEVIGDKRDFKGVKQFLIELITSVGNFILKNPKTHAIATKVSFQTVNGELKVDTAKAIQLSIENGFGDPLAPSLDETLELE